MELAVTSYWVRQAALKGKVMTNLNSNASNARKDARLAAHLRTALLATSSIFCSRKARTRLHACKDCAQQATIWLHRTYNKCAYPVVKAAKHALKEDLAQFAN